MDFAGGSFFDAATLPAPALGSRDVYMLRCVLHDWNDAKSMEILRSLRTAIGAPYRCWSQTMLYPSSLQKLSLQGLTPFPPCCDLICV